MKKITLSLSLVAITSLAIAQTNPCPTSYKRNNGSVCGSTGQLTLNYDACPVSAGIIDSVYVAGVKADVEFGAPSACSGPQHSITYCIVTGNMPPTGVWKIYFTDLLVSSRYNCTVIEGGNLPIKISSFKAGRNQNTVELRWTTSFEQNASHFEIERAVAGKSFTSIGSVPASNLEGGASYSFADVTSNTGSLQYRLKLVDLDGSYAYSEVRTIRTQGKITDFSVFPNPSSGTVKISLPEVSEETEVQVMDNSGRILRTTKLNNSNNTQINDLQKGIYMIRVTDKTTGERITKKLTVIN